MTLTTTTRHSTPKSPAEIEDGRIQLHHELTDIIRNRVGLREPYASDMAADVLAGMEELWGGGPRYFYAPDKTARDKSIRAEFIGTNADALCKKWSISRSRLYQIVSQRP